jgi:hypothetical protein
VGSPLKDVFSSLALSLSLSLSLSLLLSLSFSHTHIYTHIHTNCPSTFHHGMMQREGSYQMTASEYCGVFQPSEPLEINSSELQGCKIQSQKIQNLDALLSTGNKYLETNVLNSMSNGIHRSDTFRGKLKNISDLYIGNYQTFLNLKLQNP